MTTLFIFLSIIWIVNSQELLSNPKCNQKMDPGTCNNFAISYYYDRYAHRCREFFYSGCGGTENRFSTLQECSSQCHFVSSEETALQRCSQNHDPGTCQSDIERWYFDWNMKRCVCSWWSGCGGNSNRYYSYNHCMEICREFSQGGPVFIQPAYIAPRPEPQPGVSNYDTIAYSDYPSNDYSNFPNYNQHHPQNNIGNDNNQFVGQSQHVLAPLINTNLQHSANHQSSIQPSSVLFPSQNTNHLHSPPELDSEAVLRGNFQFPNLVNQASPLVIERPNPLKKIYGEPDLFGDFQFDPEYEISTNGEYKAMTSAKEERIFFDQKTKKPLLNLRGTRSSLDEVIRHEQEPIRQKLIVTEVKIPTFRYIMDSKADLEVSHIAPEKPFSTMVTSPLNRRRIKVARRKGAKQIEANKGLLEITLHPREYRVYGQYAKQLEKTKDQTEANRTEIIDAKASGSTIDEPPQYVSYDDYYTDMEEIRDSDVGFFNFEERIQEVPSQEVPTEPAQWTKDPKLWHPAIPPQELLNGLLSVREIQKLQNEEATTVFTPKQPPVKSTSVTSLSSNITATESPDEDSDRNRVSTTSDDSKSVDEMKPMESKGFQIDIASQEQSNKIPVTSSSSHSVQKQNITTAAPSIARIPFRASAPRPPKTLVDQWSWIRNARPTRNPSLNLISSTHPAATVPTVKWIQSTTSLPSSTTSSTTLATTTATIATTPIVPTNKPITPTPSFSTTSSTPLIPSTTVTLPSSTQIAQSTTQSSESLLLSSIVLPPEDYVH